MKKLLSTVLALCLALSLCAFANAAALSPQHGLVQDNGGEESYNVRFDPATAIDDQNNVTFTEYALDEFRRADVEALQAGDVIVSFGEEVTVESIEQDGDTVNINGGFENEGVTLVLSEEDNDVYYNMSYDDLLATTPLEPRTLPLADEVTVGIYRMEEDGSYSGAMDAQTMPAGEVRAYLLDKADTSKEDWISLDGDITIYVEDGKIIELQVNWTPNA